MSFILVTRNPRSQKLVAIEDDEGRLAEFETEKEASDAADNTTICKAWGYQVLEAE